MHETQLDNIKLNIDRFDKLAQNYFLEGWIFSEGNNLDSIQIIADDSPLVRLDEFEFRKDVVDFYGLSDEFQVGFRCKLEEIEQYDSLRVDVKYTSESNYIPCYTIKNHHKSLSLPSIKINNTTPGFIVVEDFYDDPDAVREYALSLDFIENTSYHKGRRTVEKPIFTGTKEFFESVLKTKIINWDSHLFNGVFQYCTAQDSLVYHTDTQSYAAMVYLTPDAPGETGTSFFKHKQNGMRHYPRKEDCEQRNISEQALYNDMFHGNYYDKTPWELLDVIGNVYNRLVIFDAKKVHAASGYAGDSKSNGRLFQIFFFDIEESWFPSK